MQPTDIEWIEEYFKNLVLKTHTLNQDDQDKVTITARQRTDANKTAGTHILFKGQDPYNVDLQGLGAEVAFCRMFNYEPDWSIGVRKGGWDTVSKKGNKIDIKYTSKENGDLLVKKTKKRGEIDIYVLLTGKFPKFNFIGFATDDMVFNAPITNYGFCDNYTLKQEELKKF